jgi:hypothetical protein
MSYTNEELKALRKRLSDPDEDIDPWERVGLATLLGNYGTADKRTRFGEHYDKYYAPFGAGFNNAKLTDMIPPVYKQSSPFSTEKTILRKMRYNKLQNRMSTVDPFVTSASHGLGLMTAMSGGIPGLAGGFAIKHGLPLAWSLVKNHFADKYARQRAANNTVQKYFRKISNYVKKCFSGNFRIIYAIISANK